MTVTRRGTTNQNARGSSAARAARRRWLVETFGSITGGAVRRKAA